MKSFFKFLPVFLVFLFVIFIFRNWFLTGALASGDFWYYFPSMFGNYPLHPYAWYGLIGNGIGGVGFANQNGIIMSAVIIWITKIFSAPWEVTSKIFFYFLFIVISFSSSLLLIKKIFPENKFFLVAPIIFVLNTYVLMLVGGGQILTALSYSLMPISLYFLIRLVETKEKLSSFSLFTISLSLILLLQSVLDLRIAFVTSIIIFIYLFVSWFYREIRIKNLLCVLTSFILVGIMSSCWLIPVLFLGINPIAQLGSSYTSVDMVKFLSFAKLENSIGLLHPYWPENIFGKIGFMRPEFLILPLLAFASLLFVGRKNSNKFILFFTLTALVGIFLGKGASDPFGSFYIWLFSHVPGFQLFRDSVKWYTLIALSYSILIPFSINEIYNFIKSKDKFSEKSKIFNPSNLFALLTVCLILFLIRPAFVNNLGGTFVKRSVPVEYQELNNYLSSGNSFYRTLWIPNTMLFGYYSNNNPEISGRDFFREYDDRKLLNKFKNPSEQKLLDESSVRYVIVPQDSEKEIFLTERKYDDKKYQSVVSSLDKIPWLIKDKEIGKIVVYRTASYKDHFWCDCSAQVSYKFINPTKYIVNVKGANENDKLIFSETYDPNWIAQYNGSNIKSRPFDANLNSFILPSGDSTLEINYNPQKYVDFGLKLSLILFGTLIVVLLVILVNKAKK